MALYTDYQNVNNLTTISFIAGTTYSVRYQVKNSSGVVQDISTATMRLLLSPYGQPTVCSLNKLASIYNAHTFQVDLIPSDTSELNGVYIQQPLITDISGQEFRDKQGLVLIMPANAES